MSLAITTLQINHYQVASSLYPVGIYPFSIFVAIHIRLALQCEIIPTDQIEIISIDRFKIRSIYQC